MIFLLGFKSSGKSTLGKALAKVLGLPFWDMDELIGKPGQPIQDVFLELGALAFRKKESEILKKLALKHQGLVATGGGIITQAGNHRILKKGFCVHVLTPFEKIAQRIVWQDKAHLFVDQKQAAGLYQQRLPIFRSLCQVEISQVKFLKKELVRWQTSLLSQKVL